MADPAAVDETAPARDRVLDAARGGAILLMLIDHLIVAAADLLADPDFGMALRRTVTRLSMPLFMIVSGALWARRPPARRRVAAVAAAASGLNVLLALTWPGFALPEILAVWVLLTPLARMVAAHPVELGVLGLLQSVYHPVGWGGYEPGYVLVFLALGVLWERAGRPGAGGQLLGADRRGFGALAAVGRRPLVIYTVHLAALAVLIGVTG